MASISALGASVRKDFDGIARALGASGVGDELPPYERALLGYLPASCDRVLEVGCGDGALTQQVARRARTVLALDLSPEMVRLAQTRSVGQNNIDFRVADLAATELPPRQQSALRVFDAPSQDSYTRPSMT